jgi:hypothetical protein
MVKASRTYHGLFVLELLRQTVGLTASRKDEWQGRASERKGRREGGKPRLPKFSDRSPPLIYVIMFSAFLLLD